MSIRKIAEIAGVSTATVSRVTVLEKLMKQYKSIVSVNWNSTNHMVDEVLCDGRQIAALAVDYLIQLGHRKIGYVGDCHNESRYNGYRLIQRLLCGKTIRKRRLFLCLQVRNLAFRVTGFLPLIIF